MPARRVRLGISAVAGILIGGAAVFALWQSSRFGLGVSLMRSASQIAYLQYNQQGADAYVLDVNTGAITQLTMNYRVQGLEWSADGERLLLSIDEKNRAELIVASGQLDTLPNSEASSQLISPDQAYFAYDRCGPDTGRYAGTMPDSASVFIVEAANPANVRENKFSCYPAWSPQGDQIAFTSVQGSDVDPDIYIENTDGSNLHRLVKKPALDILPQWSPTGERIAFMSVAETEDPAYAGIYLSTLYVVDADGQNLTQVDSLDSLGTVRWSPDGQTLLYSSGNGQVCATAGESETPVCTPDSAYGGIWSNDGTQAAYAKINGPICVADPFANFLKVRCFPGTEYAIRLAWRP